MDVFAAFSGGKIFSGFPGFSASTQRGTRTAAGVFALTGRLLFCTRKPGCSNCVSVFAPNGRLLFCADCAGHSNCRRRVRPSRAESFSLNLSVGFAVCGRRERRGARRAGAKRKDNLRFSFLFELLPFPCFLIWRRFPICDRFEIGERQRIFSSVFFVTCSQCQIPYCYTYGLLCAGRDIAVSRDSLARCYRQGLRG